MRGVFSLRHHLLPIIVAIAFHAQRPASVVHRRSLFADARAQALGPFAGAPPSNSTPAPRSPTYPRVAARSPCARVIATTFLRGRLLAALERHALVFLRACPPDVHACLRFCVVAVYPRVVGSRDAVLVLACWQARPLARFCAEFFFAPAQPPATPPLISNAPAPARNLALRSRQCRCQSCSIYFFVPTPVLDVAPCIHPRGPLRPISRQLFLPLWHRRQRNPVVILLHDRPAVMSRRAVAGTPSFRCFLHAAAGRKLCGLRPSFVARPKICEFFRLFASIG